MTSIDDSNRRRELISQWVSSMVNQNNQTGLGSVMGPIRAEHQPDYSRVEIIPSVEHDFRESGIQNEIIFKINEKVYIEEVNFYVKARGDSSVMKLEALKSNDDNTTEWFLMWKSEQRFQPSDDGFIMKPIVAATPFKTDTIKLNITGNVILIDAIEIKGSKIAVEDDSRRRRGQLSDKNSYSLLSRQMNTLVENELFADVFFEVEGKIVPAHRNILVIRSPYFRAMLGPNSLFKENTESQHSTASDPIYIKDIRYSEFIQILSFLYTGHIDIYSLPFDVTISLMRLADSMNMCELEQLCLFQLSQIIDRDNVVKIFKEAYESSPEILKNVVQLSYEVMSANFAYVSRSPDFCSLSQDLMLKIIENVVPKLARLNSAQVEAQPPASSGFVRPQTVHANRQASSDSDSDDEDF